jgi:LPXTG-motif cell wall-anchored protein
VRTRRWLVTCLLLLAAFAFAVPAVTLASGGCSAGDQQYTDPFGGSSSSGKSKTTTTSAPSTSTQPPTTSAPTASATPAASTSTASDPTSTPTATIASTATNQLPHTGYDSRLAAVLGFVLAGGGLGLRARLRRT